MDIRAELENTKAQTWKTTLLIAMFAICMLCPFICYGCMDGHMRQAYQIGMMGCVFLVPVWFLIRYREDRPEMEGDTVALSAVCFLISYLMVIISVYVNTCFLWISGCIILTAIFNTGTGIAFFLYFACMFSLLNSATATYEIFMFLMGICVCFGVIFLKSTKGRIVSVFWGPFCYTVLYFIFTNGSREYFSIQTALAIAGIMLSMLAAGLIHHRLYS